MNDTNIDDALQLGLHNCLRSLQHTNPSIIFTSNKLKRAERDTRYVPAVAASLASIVAHSVNIDFKREVMRLLFSWKQNDALGGTFEVCKKKNLGVDATISAAKDSFLSKDEKETCKVNIVGPLLEDRIRLVLSWNSS